MNKLARLFSKKKSEPKKVKSKVMEIIDQPDSEFPDESNGGDSVKSSKISFTHKWTLENFYKFYDEKHLWKSYICSEDFSPPNNEQFVFSLYMFPNKNDCISIVVSSIALPSMYDGKIKCKSRASIVNENGEICFSMEFALHDLFQWNGKHFYFINHQKLVDSVREYLPNGNLTLYFKIHLQAEENIFNVPKKDNVNYLGESLTDGNTKVTRLAYTWTVENADRLFEESSTVPQYIQSDCFPSNNKSDNFHLRLYPNGFDSKNAACVDIGVVKDNGATAHCKISIFDVLGVKSFMQEETRKTTYYRGFIEKFISRDYLLDPENRLLNDNKLRIHCEIDYMSNSLDESEVNMRFNEYENVFKMESTFDVEPKVFHFTEHKWQVDKLASVENKKGENYQNWLSSKVFSSSYDPRIKFALQLFPFGDGMDQCQGDNVMTLYVNRASLVGETSPVEVPAQFQISILQENGDKYTREAWHRVMHKGEDVHRLQLIGRDFLFDPQNGLLSDGNLTILCEIWIISDKKMYPNIEGHDDEPEDKAKLPQTIKFDNINQSFINIGNAKTGHVLLQKLFKQ